MLLTATVACYDVMETVWVRAQVREYGQDGEIPPYVPLTWEIYVPGEGVTDPREWLRDALVALLEAL